jgi:spermidine synthase
MGRRLTAFSAGVGILLAQIVWNRQLVLLLGGSVDSTAAVLAAFMLGLGLGGRVFGLLSQRSKRPAAFLRRILALCALASFLPFLGSRLAVHVYPHLYGSGLPVLPVRFVMSLVLVFPATFLAGGVVPVMARIVQGAGGERETARLYGINAVGSAIGGFLAGFVLLEVCGAAWTLVVGAALLILPSVLYRERVPAAIRGAEGGERPSWFLLGVYAVSGMIALAYESVWTRQLSFVLGNSTYAFSLMGVMVLLGIGLGSIAGQKAGSRVASPLVGLAVVETALGVASMVPLSALGSFNAVVDLFNPGGWSGTVLGRTMACGLYMLPSTMLMGATFPLMVMAAARSERLGEDVGTLSMANCIGAALGPILASMVLFRLLGVTVSSAVLACGSIALGALLFLKASRRGLVALCPVAAALVVALVAGSAPPGSQPPPNMELLFFREDRTATLSVFGREWDSFRSLRINGVEEVPIDQPSLEAFYYLGHLPWGYNPDAERAMVVALGGGVTAGALLTHPVEEVVCVELCPGLMESLSLFERENRRPDMDERFQLVADDGRNFLLGNSASYDIVICDATHPGSVDSWVLYTREFYGLVLSRLAEEGIAAQWVPLHQLPPEEMLRILATWARVFPHAAVHLAWGRHMVLVGSPSELSLSVEAMFRDREARRQLESLGYDVSYPEQLMPLLNDRHLDRLSERKNLRSNTDTRAYCQFIRSKLRGGAQSTITPNVASALSLRDRPPSDLRLGQMLYWEGRLPRAADVMRGLESPLGRRWLSVCLTTAAEQLVLADRGSESIPLLQEALAADSSWSRPRRLLELVESQQ